MQKIYFDLRFQVTFTSSVISCCTMPAKPPPRDGKDCFFGASNPGIYHHGMNRGIASMISRAYTSWCMIGTFETYIFSFCYDPRDPTAIMWLFCGRQIGGQRLQKQRELLLSVATDAKPQVPWEKVDC